MTLSKSEFNHQLREVEQMNTQVMPKWREVLERVFSGEEKLSIDQKAEMLGVPSRRSFFRVGGTMLAGAAVLAACGDDDDDDTTDGAVGDDVDDTEEAGGGNMDIVLANTAISLEVLAIDTYQTAIDSGLVTDAAVAGAATLFQDHHAQHRDALVGVVEGAGATPFLTANPAVKAALIDPALANPDLDQAAIIQIAYDLEQAAAQTYVFAATALSTPQLRSTIMTIGGVESRHATILSSVGATSADIGAFYSAENPLAGIEGAVITSS